MSDVPVPPVTDEQELHVPYYSVRYAQELCSECDRPWPCPESGEQS